MQDSSPVSRAATRRTTRSPRRARGSHAAQPAKRRFEITVPSRTEPIARSATEVLGGAVGDHARVGTRGFVRAASILAALSSVLIALDVLLKWSCLSSGFAAPRQYWRVCYSGLVSNFASTGMQNGNFSTADGKPIGEPLLSGLSMWLVGRITPGTSGTLLQQQGYFGLWAGLAVLLLAGAILAMAWATPRDPWRAAHLALSPILVTVALISSDILGVALVAVALAAWQRERAVLAGVSLGFSLLTAVYPWLVLVAIVLVAIRRGQMAQMLRTVGVALLTLGLFLVPFLALRPETVTAWPKAWRNGGVGYGSLLMLGSPFNTIPGTDIANVYAAVGLCLALAVGFWLALGRWGTPSVGAVALAMVAVTMILAKDLPVQHSLWLLPMLAATGPAWRDHLIWAGLDSLHFVMVWMHIGKLHDAGKALPAGWYVLFVVLRMAGIAWVARAGYLADEERRLWGVAWDEPEPDQMTRDEGDPEPSTGRAERDDQPPAYAPARI